MTLDPFRQPGCTCYSLGDKIRAGIDGVELVLCSVHEADEIEERRVASEVAHAEADRDRLMGVVADARAAAVVEPECCCVDVKSALVMSLEGGEISACPVHDRSQPAQPPSVSPGDDVGLARIIAGAFGVPVTLNDNDLPPRAA